MLCLASSTCQLVQGFGRIVLLVLLAGGSFTLPASAQERLILQGHTGEAKLGRVLDVAFAPDGQTLASASADQTVILWEVATGKERQALRHAGPVNCVAYAPDGLTLATGSAAAAPSSGQTPGQLRLWDVASGKELGLVTGHTEAILSVAFTPDGKTLASGGAEGVIKLWDVASLKETASLPGHAGSVQAVTFAPDGKTLASASNDGTVRLWDPATGKTRATLQGTMEFRSVAFSADGQKLAAAERPRKDQAQRTGPDRMFGQVRVWDTATLTEQAVIKRRTGDVRTAFFTPDSKLLVFIDHKNIMVYDAGAAKPRQRADFLPKSGVVTTSLALSPDGRLLATGGADALIRVWDMARVLEPQPK